MTGPRFQPLSKAKRRAFADLGTAKGRMRRGLFMLEGARSIDDALRRGARFPFLVVRERDRAAFEAACDDRTAEAVVYLAGEDDFRRLSQTETPQAVIAIGRLPDLSLAALPEGAPGLTLLADEVRDPGNLGTLLRTLAAVGGRTALLPAGNVDPLNPKAMRASAGSVLSLAIATGMSRGEAISWCVERGIGIVALASGAPDLFRARLPSPPFAVAVGNEATGVSGEILDRAAAVVGIPMPGNVESLSVATAGSIGLYAIGLGLQRRTP